MDRIIAYATARFPEDLTFLVDEEIGFPAALPAASRSADTERYLYPELIRKIAGMLTMEDLWSFAHASQSTLRDLLVPAALTAQTLAAVHRVSTAKDDVRLSVIVNRLESFHALSPYTLGTVLCAFTTRLGDRFRRKVIAWNRFRSYSEQSQMLDALYKGQRATTSAIFTWHNHMEKTWKACIAKAQDVSLTGRGCSSNDAEIHHTHIIISQTMVPLLGLLRSAEGHYKDVLAQPPHLPKIALSFVASHLLQNKRTPDVLVTLLDTLLPAGQAVTVPLDDVAVCELIGRWMGLTPYGTLAIDPYDPAAPCIREQCRSRLRLSDERLRDVVVPWLAEELAAEAMSKEDSRRALMRPSFRTIAEWLDGRLQRWDDTDSDLLRALQRAILNNTMRRVHDCHSLGTPHWDRTTLSATLHRRFLGMRVEEACLRAPVGRKGMPFWQISADLAQDACTLSDAFERIMAIHPLLQPALMASLFASKPGDRHSAQMKEARDTLAPQLLAWEQQITDLAIREALPDLAWLALSTSMPVLLLHRMQTDPEMGWKTLMDRNLLCSPAAESLLQAASPAQMLPLASRLWNVTNTMTDIGCDADYRSFVKSVARRILSDPTIRLEYADKHELTLLGEWLAKWWEDVPDLPEPSRSNLEVLRARLADNVTVSGWDFVREAVASHILMTWLSTDKISKAALRERRDLDEHVSKEHGLI